MLRERGVIVPEAGEGSTASAAGDAAAAPVTSRVGAGSASPVVRYAFENGGEAPRDARGSDENLQSQLHLQVRGQQQDGGGSSNSSGGEEDPPPPLTPLEGAFPRPGGPHTSPAVVPLAELPGVATATATSITAGGQPAAAIVPSSSTTSLSDRPFANIAAPAPAPVNTLTSRVESRVSVDAPSGPGRDATAAGPAVNTQPYTTFQQLEYLPVVPPSVLSSSYVIPPTYDSVLATGSPMPSQLSNGVFDTPNLGSSSGLLSPPTQHNTPHIGSSRTPVMLSGETFANANTTTATAPDTPLLSPVSLLANPSARNIGPPGLFFVSKGKGMTSIVVSPQPSLLSCVVNEYSGQSS